MSASSPDDALPLQEAADQLGVHYMTAYKYVRTGRLAAEKVGGQWQVSKAALDAFQRDQRPTGSKSLPAGARADRFRERSLAGDEPGAWRIVEDALGAGWDPADVHRQVVVPVLHEVGELWAAGTIDVVDEHRASAIVRRVVARLGPHFAVRGRTRGTVVIGAAPGDAHEIGLAVLADLFRSRNVGVAELGGNTPAEAFGQAARAADRPLAVAVGLSDPSATPGIQDVVVEVAGIVPVFVGGYAADAALADAVGAIYCASLDDVVTAVIERHDATSRTA